MKTNTKREKITDKLCDYAVRIFIILLLGSLLAIIISAFISADTIKTEPTQPGSFGDSERFILVDEWTSSSDRECQVYADTITNVMYLCIRDGNMGGLSVLLNEDGSPMMYDSVEEEIMEEGLG